MLRDKRRADPQATAQPMQQAQPLVQRGAFDRIAAILGGSNGEPMIALDFEPRANDILLNGGIIDAIETAEGLRGSNLPRQKKRQQYRNGVGERKVQMAGRALTSSVESPVSMFDKNS